MTQASDNDLSAALMALEENSPHDSKLAVLRARASVAFLQAVREMDAFLASEIADHAALPPSPQVPKAMTVLALTATARQREANIKSRLDLATMLVIGALDNQNNPQWDPANPDSNRRDGSPNPMLALLGIAPDTRS